MSLSEPPPLEDARNPSSPYPDPPSLKIRHGAGTVGIKSLRAPSSKSNQKRVLAVASGGGHWEQLMMLRPAFQGYKTHFAVTNLALAAKYNIQRAHKVPDFNATRPVATFVGAFAIAGLINRLKPDVVISTGAAPGLIALLIGRLYGAKALWIDSIANAEKLSLSGRLAAPFAHVRVTQWSHLARTNGPRFLGSVL